MNECIDQKERGASWVLFEDSGNRSFHPLKGNHKSGSASEDLVVDNAYYSSVCTMISETEGETYIYAADSDDESNLQRKLDFIQRKLSREDSAFSELSFSSSGFSQCCSDRSRKVSAVSSRNGVIDEVCVTNEWEKFTIDASMDLATEELCGPQDIFIKREGRLDSAFSDMGDSLSPVTSKRNNLFENMDVIFGHVTNSGLLSNVSSEHSKTDHGKFLSQRNEICESDARIGHEGYFMGDLMLVNEPAVPDDSIRILDYHEAVPSDTAEQKLLNDPMSPGVIASKEQMFSKFALDDSTQVNDENNGASFEVFESPNDAPFDRVPGFNPVELKRKLSSKKGKKPPNGTRRQKRNTNGFSDESKMDLKFEEANNEEINTTLFPHDDTQVAASPVDVNRDLWISFDDNESGFSVRSEQVNNHASAQVTHIGTKQVKNGLLNKLPDWNSSRDTSISNLSRQQSGGNDLVQETGWQTLPDPNDNYVINYDAVSYNTGTTTGWKEVTSTVQQQSQMLQTTSNQSNFGTPTTLPRLETKQTNPQPATPMLTQLRKQEETHGINARLAGDRCSISSLHANEVSNQASQSNLTANLTVGALKTITSSQICNLLEIGPVASPPAHVPGNSVLYTNDLCSRLSATTVVSNNVCYTSYHGVDVIHSPERHYIDVDVTKDGNHAIRQSIGNVCNQNNELESVIEILSDAASDKDQQKSLSNVIVSKTEDVDELPSLDDYPPPEPNKYWTFWYKHCKRKKLFRKQEWIRVTVLVDGGAIKVGVSQSDDDLLKEIPLHPFFSFSPPKLKAVERQSKIHVTKLQYVKYKEKRNYGTKFVYQHVPSYTTILKLGSKDLGRLRKFTECVNNVIRVIHIHRDKGISYAHQEIFVDSEDLCQFLLSGDGDVINYNVTVQMQVRAFVSAAPSVSLYINDEKYKNIQLPVSSESSLAPRPNKWIKVLKPEFHPCVDKETSRKRSCISFVPPDGCKFELVRFRLHHIKELPVLVKCTLDVASSNSIKIKAEVKLGGEGRSAKFVRNDVEMHFPIPHQWTSIFVKCKDINGQKQFMSCSANSVSLEPGRCKSSRCSMSVSLGSAQFQPEFSAIIWKIGDLPFIHSSLPMDATHSFSCDLDLPFEVQLPDNFAPFAELEFYSPHPLESDVCVRDITVGSDAFLDKWIHYSAYYSYKIMLKVLKYGKAVMK